MPASIASTTPVRIGVVGAGLIGRKHISVLTDGTANATLAGIVDTSSVAKAEANAAGLPFFDGLEEMIAATQPDGIVIAVPNQFHVEVGLTCVQHGLPILIEKPVADTVADALRLIDAAEAAGVATLTGHHRRHNPILQHAARVIQGGELGRVVAATSMWWTHKPKGYHDLAWRREPGGGPVLINVIHEIDCLRMLCGEIASIQAATSDAIRQLAVEDTVAVIVRFRSGALGTITLSDTISSPWSWETTSGENPTFPKTSEDSIWIGGTQGSLAIPSLRLHSYETGQEDWLKPLRQHPLEISHADPYVLQMQNFANVIRGHEKPVLTGHEGTKTLQATLAILQSAKTGRPVAVDTL